MFKYVVYLYIIYRLLFSVIKPVYAEPVLQNTKLYPVTGVQNFVGNPHLPNIVWYTTITLPWKSGKVILSGNPDGTGMSDVGVSLEVYGSDQTKRFIYNATCSENLMPPLDITHLMGPRYPSSDPDGVSNIFIRYNRKNCSNSIKVDGVSKAYMDISPLYLVHFLEEDYIQKPFLDLPFDYKSQGLTFDEAVLGASSFFDHEYPFLSSGLKESTENNKHKTLVSFGDSKRSNIAYSSHDGYDFARRAGVKLGTPVLAAAKGTATARWYGGCGQMIEIDHKNGFQTRYCHLSSNNLITAGAPVDVIAGQKIGEVGLTGNTTGAHIHFVLVQDKNGDSNFEDNIPDGVLDPLGFLAKEPDPWRYHTFWQNNTQKTGNRSGYLFTEKLSGGTYTVTPDGNRITFSGGNVDIPAQMVTQDKVLKIEVLPPATNPKIAGDTSYKLLASWGNRVKMTIHDGFLNFVKSFDKSFRLSLKINPALNYPFDLSTLALYSSQDGENWIKEASSFLDLENNIIHADINHLTEFALLGELKSDLSLEEISMWQGSFSQHIYEEESTQDQIQITDFPASTLTPKITLVPTINTDIKLTPTPTLIDDINKVPSPTINKSEKNTSNQNKSEDKNDATKNDKTISDSSDKVQKESVLINEDNSNAKNATDGAILGTSDNINTKKNKSVDESLLSMLFIVSLSFFMIFWIIFVLKKN